MATINLFQLYVTGSELFHDSESFLNELSDVDAISQNQDTIVGGIFSISALSGAFVGTFAIGHGSYTAKSFSQPRSKYSRGFGW
ncbi:hypothetical protein [Nostoc sp. CCY0012]|uniref:hypothetical protein n=1 Tax=Nostoc sp. CCY0012 TaxID=1056123 RepID=UPI0039C74F12